MRPQFDAVEGGPTIAKLLRLAAFIHTPRQRTTTAFGTLLRSPHCSDDGRYRGIVLQNSR